MEYLHNEAHNTPPFQHLIKKWIILTTSFIILLLAIHFFVPDYLQKIARGLSILLFLVLFLRLILAFFIHKKSKKFRFFVQLIYLFTAIIVSFIVMVQVLAPSVMFYTYFAEDAYEKLLTVPNAEEITIDTDQGTLSGWFLHHVEDSAPLIIYFGGNAENSAARILRLLDRPQDLETFSGYNFVFIDYPGYGKSDGLPTADSLRQYGLSVYDAMAAREDVTDITVLAFSIGTGVGNYVSSQRLVDNLILFAPYADGVDLYNNYLNIFHGPLALLVPYDMEAIKYAAHIQLKPLIIASKSDQIVSYNSSLRLASAYPLGTSFITLDGVGHNDIWNTPDVLSTVRKYLSDFDD